MRIFGPLLILAAVCWAATTYVVPAMLRNTPPAGYIRPGTNPRPLNVERCSPTGTCSACTTCSSCRWCNSGPDNHCSACRNSPP